MRRKLHGTSMTTSERMMLYFLEESRFQGINIEFCG